MMGKVAEMVSIREKTVPSSLGGSTAANPDLWDYFEELFECQKRPKKRHQQIRQFFYHPPDQNPLQTGKRIESSCKIEEPGLGGDGHDAEVGGPRDGGEGGDGHARHLQLPRQQRQHQELAAVVEQPEVSLNIFRRSFLSGEDPIADLEVKQSICPPVEDMCCPKHHEDVLPDPR